MTSADAVELRSSGVFCSDAPMDRSRRRSASEAIGTSSDDPDRWARNASATARCRTCTVVASGAGPGPPDVIPVATACTLIPETGSMPLVVPAPMTTAGFHGWTNDSRPG